MLLDFTNPVLDPRITFSRGTNATLVDRTGKITYAPANLVQYSQEFDNAAWTKTAATVTANATTAPDGTMTADALVETTAAGTGHWTFQSITTTAVAHTVSCYIKPNGRDWALIRIRDASSNDRYAWFNIATGTVGTVQTNLVASITGAGNGWFRCVITVSAALAGSNPIVIGAATADNVFSYTGDGTSGLYLWGSQVEQVTYQTTPGPYVATTASAYYGPRFDYDPVTLAPRGLLIEEARTNLLLRSGEIGTAPWAVYGTASVSANATSAPDGTTSADLITFGAVDNGYQQTDIAIGASISVTLSFYVKANVGTQIRYAVPCFDAANTFLGGLNNTSSTITSGQLAANGWYRISVTFTTPAGTTKCAVRILGAAVSDSAYVWGAQLEAGAFATSYIPTVASTVSRSADVATMTGTNFSTWYNQSEGTFAIDSVYSPVLGTSYGLACAFQSASNFININNNGNRSLYINVGGVVQVDLSPGGYAAYAPAKIASAYKVNDFATTINARTVLTDTSGTLPAPTELRIGRDAQDLYINNHIRAIAYYNTRLPNTQLQTLTAPSLASPLALDFISPTYTVGY
jgi:hypothetical protein